MPSDSPKIRTATSLDAETVARLHVASWRAHYRGALSDSYLDGPIEGERRAVWAERLRHPHPDTITLLLLEAEVAIGFVHVMVDHDRTYGSLVDNLHVAAGRKGAGHGKRLMHAAAEALLYRIPHRPITLFALSSNKAARGFYEHIGGEEVGEERKTEPDGSQVLAVRYLWPDAAALMAATEPRDMAGL